MNYQQKIIRPIFSQKLAGTLMVKGFVLVSMEPNENGSGKNVFYFNDSPALEKEIQNFTQQKRKG